ncbi:type VI secretion system baseplate subunit TssE [Dongshaea marina]|uniref:type VI secretion system baseplate subunit TssE n=1 Tax=Dongshaea marina TaxID=2047966 RepID=UPI00131F03C7|nr:type VI secretion system baseplate subunit TssE [Dongshaea marina]
MRTERLLERIRYGENPDGHDSELVRLSSSVTRYLSRMLNTQQGSALTVPDFGMPDLNLVRFGEGLENLRGLERVIADLILRYEPRVERVQVEFIPQETDRLSLVFKIRAGIRYENNLVPVVFETVLGPDGRISVAES